MMRKKHEPIAKWTHVAVRWEDAWGDHASHKSEKLVDDYVPCIRTTVGFVLADTPDRLFLGSTRDVPEDDEDTDTCEVNVIPRGIILEIATLTKTVVSRRRR